MTETQAHRPMYGESGYERREADAYWTPAWCTEALCDAFTFHGPIWEPACGKGHISKVLLSRGYRVTSTDLNDHGFGGCNEDFLSWVQPRLAKNIVTNPPYNLSDGFVRTALKFAEPVGGAVAMLLRNEWDSAVSRMGIMQRLRLKLVLTKRPRWSEDDKASPRHNFAWFIWDFSHTGRPEIQWTKGNE